MPDNNLAILLPHYNNYKGLEVTLSSLLDEEEIFTLFIFDDGSDDLQAVNDVVDKFRNNLNVQLERNEQNLGITKTLNKGLELILSLNTYELIARLDAGDKCLNNRLRKQKEFLSKNLDVGLVSSWVQFVDENREELFVFKAPKQHSKLKKVIHWYNPFIHPAIMFRTDVVRKIGSYPEDFETLEDHAFFFKVIKSFKTGVLQEVLLEYEVNPSAISTVKRKSQAGNRIKLLKKEFKFGLYPITGLIRAIITYLTPQSVLVKLKKHVFYR
jgi:glycosyltransferase involved in cell wall biosynthesis